MERNEPARTSFSSTEGKSSIRKVTSADPVEQKKFQPFSDGTIKKETQKHTSSMVSEGLKDEGKRPIRKVTFSDFVELKMFQPFSDGIIKEETGEHTAFMVSEDLKAQILHSKNETESVAETVNDKPDCVNLDPCFKLCPTPPPVSSNSACAIIAPPDADPLPPYDPILNHLSPRPQFLYYKPNPRVKLYKERECVKLDSVEQKKFQPFSDGTIKKETEKHTSSMVSEGLKAEGKRSIRKVTFADFVEVKMFQPFSDGVVEDETEKHTALMVSEDLKAKVLRSKNETESSFETLNDKPGCANLDPSFKLSPTPPPVSSDSTIIAPPDADPIPPYDPILNYLSPRPQFRYYKPNPRVKLYKQRECMKLDDSISETLFDGSENDTGSAFETGSDEPDCVNVDPSFKPGPTPPPVSSNSTIIAPPDAEPIPPYDPILNYLSPRPQFLYCKPNPRVKVYKEREFMKLDDSFSDTELMEEVLSDGSEKESKVTSDDPLIPPYNPKLNYLSPRPQFLYYKPNPRFKLCKERECMKLDDSFSDTELTEEAPSDGSEKESEVSSDEIVGEEKSHVSCEAKGVAKAKSSFSMRSKAIALLLLLSVACVSISFTNSQVFDPLFKDRTILSQAYDSSEFSPFARASFDLFSELAKENLDGLSQNFHIWFAKWMFSISELISTFRGVQNLGHLHYWNLTGLQEDIEVNHFPICCLGEKLIGEAPQVETLTLNVEDNDELTDTYTDVDNGDSLAEHYDSAYEEQEDEELEPVPPILRTVDGNDTAKKIDTYEAGNTQVESASSASEFEEVSEPNHSESNIDYPDIFSETCENNTEVFEANSFKAKQAPENDATVIMDFKDQPDLNSEVAEIHTDDLPDLNSEVSETAKICSDDLPDLNFEVAEIAEIHTDDQPGLNSEIHTKVYHDIQLKSEENFLSVESVIIASMLLFLSKIAGTTFRWLRKKDQGRRTMATGTSSMEHPHLAKTLHVNHKEEASLEKPSLRNGPIEMDAFGESCPSEISTFQRSLSYYSQRVLKEQNEAQSLVKKPKKNYRRESLASSESMGGSTYYGSFTTYVKLSSKHGHGDASIVTPSRR